MKETIRYKLVIPMDSTLKIIKDPYQSKSELKLGYISYLIVEVTRV